MFLHHRLCIFTAVLLAACCIGEGQQLTHEITTSALPSTFSDGNNFQLQCTFDSSRFSFLHWVHPNQGPLTGSEQVFLSSQSARLIITGADQSDDGEYRCVFSQTNGASDVYAAITPTYHPLIVFLTHFSVPVVELSGTNISLLCLAKNHRHIQWQKDFSTIQIGSPTDRVYTESFSNSTHEGVRLYILLLALSDSGLYSCVASNQVQSIAQVTANITANEIPTVTITPTSFLIDSAPSASIVCTTRGAPRPAIVWSSDSGGLDFTGSRITVRREILNDYEVRETLTFNPVQTADVGTYRCTAANGPGSDFKSASLQISGTPSAPREITVTLVDRRDVNVSWLAPSVTGNGPIISYTIVWQTMDSTGLGSAAMASVSPSQTSYTIKDLVPVTHYIVTVHASNGVGRGRDSVLANVTTNAIVPSAPLSLGYVDVGPESVIVVWLLSPDIGGAAIESVHVLYRTSDQLWGDALSKEIPVEPNANTHHEMSVKILNLKSNSQYQLRVMASNRVGASEPRVSVLFDTPPLGYPGSPSRVAVGNLSDTSASVSWVPSEIGRPFFGYEVIALREDSSVMEVRVSFKIEEVEKVVGGMEAALVGGLAPVTCYKFSVAVRNANGVGTFSQPSSSYCTEDQPKETGSLEAEASGFSTVYVAAIVVVLVILILSMVLLALIGSLCYRRARPGKKYDVTGKSHVQEAPRRDSEKHLMDSSDASSDILTSSLSSYHRQSSGGNASSVSISVSDPTETPGTSTTLLSIHNPFDYSQPSHPHAVTAPQPHTITANPAYGGSSPALRAHSSHSLPHAMTPPVGGAFRLCPAPPSRPIHMTSCHSVTSPPWMQAIPEGKYPSQHHHTHSLPQGVHPHFVPAHTHTRAHIPPPPPLTTHAHIPPPPPLTTHENGFDMMDNPVFEEEEKKMGADNDHRHVPQPHIPERADSDPEDDIPPPVPPYLGGDETESAFLGESCSHPSRSPRLERGAASTDPTFHVGASDEEDDGGLEFTENDAYEVIEVGPIHSREASHTVSRGVMMERSSPPLGSEGAPVFEIRSQERGAVFERVDLRRTPNQAAGTVHF